MERLKNLRWIFAIVVIVAATAAVRAAVNTTVYLPVVMAEATLTPTFTLTPTVTQTPTATSTSTSTPTPDYVMIIEIVNSDTGDPLNEYVKIRNYDSQAVSLTDWFIRDDGTNRYNFPAGFSLASGSNVRLWTKAGTNSTTDLYWNSPVEVWNDSRDCAYLRDDSQGENELVDIYCYQTTQNGTVIIIRNPSE